MKASIKKIVMVLLAVGVPVSCGRPESSLNEPNTQAVSDNIKIIQENAALITRGKYERAPLSALGAGNQSVILNSIVLAEGVSLKKPVSPGTRFLAVESQKIYAVLDVKNDSDETAELTVSWKMPFGEKEIDPTTLVVKAATNWRTWSSTRFAQTPGTWEAVVRNANGHVIARAPFEIMQ